LIGILIISGCGETGGSARLAQSSQPNPVATVPYLPPTVVPTTAPTAPATATPHSTGSSGPTKPAPTVPPAKVPPGPLPNGTVPNIGGQLILVSLSQQWLWAYQNHQLVFRTAITSGMPQLPTLDGTFHVRFHERNVTFYSPWPPSSPYYYTPEHINYAMYYQDYGYYIHDAPWRHQFGPGTNYPHVDADGAHETGSHGCVNVPTGAMSWIYSWAGDGATVVIYGTAPLPPPATPTPKPTTPTPTPPPPPTATPAPPADPTPTPGM
jgi:lipoprotein-anchoring transpeptidase ErfK/SrfK